VRPLGQILDALESFHGVQAPGSPTEPYLFLVWWHCGYPPGEERCSRGWKALNAEVGVAPDDLLAASSARLARILKAGGLVPELRARRLKEIARRIRTVFSGDLRAGLRALPVAEARAALRKFPGVGNPGADRILLFGDLAPIAAVPSSCPHVLVRIESGRVPAAYPAVYAEAQRALEAQLPAASGARTRAYLLLQRHGRTLCKLTNPKCSTCPVAPDCAFFAASAARPPARRAKAAPAGGRAVSGVAHSAASRLKSARSRR
jgi:endonuclease III